MVLHITGCLTFPLLLYLLAFPIDLPSNLLNVYLDILVNIENQQYRFI